MHVKKVKNITNVSCVEKKSISYGIHIVIATQTLQISEIKFNYKCKNENLGCTGGISLTFEYEFIGIEGKAYQIIESTFVL